jgi:hypothetical protein
VGLQWIIRTQNTQAERVAGPWWHFARREGLSITIVPDITTLTIGQPQRFSMSLGVLAPKSVSD